MPETYFQASSVDLPRPVEILTLLQTDSDLPRDLESSQEVSNPLWILTLVVRRNWYLTQILQLGQLVQLAHEIQLASDLAACMITGKSSSTTFQQSLTERYRRQLGRADAALPTPLEFS